MNTLTSKNKNPSQPNIKKTLLLLLLLFLVDDCILMYLKTKILYIYKFLILYVCLFGVFFFLYTLASANLKS